MNKLISFIVLVLLINTAKAQTNGIIKGKVVDSLLNEVLERSTVAIVNPKDSSLVSYTLTNKNGEFCLRNLPAGIDLKVVISYITYKNFRKTFQLKPQQSLDFGLIKMQGNPLKEVVISSERMAVMVKKDTIEFSPEAFKTRPNAVIEDLLRVLPGVQVNFDGSASVNGKKVKKVMVDGNDFFGTNINAATRNLNVNLVDKVQIYDDREDDPDHLVPETQVKKIINLQLKKSIKKSTSGKLYAGAGSRDRAEIGGLINHFRDTLQVSLLAFNNNTNKRAFSSGDLNEMAGFQRAEARAVSTGGNRLYGIQELSSAGININSDWAKKLKTNLMYFYTHSSELNNGNTRTETRFNDFNQVSQSKDSNTDDEHQHKINSLVVWKINEKSNIRFTPQLQFVHGNLGRSYTSESQINDQNLNNTSNNNQQKCHGFNYTHKFTYNLNLPKKASFRWINDLDLSNSLSDYYTETSSSVITNGLSEDTYQKQVRNNKKATHYFHSWLTYRYPITEKLLADGSFGTSLDNSIDNNSTNLYNPETNNYSQFISSQSKDLERQTALYHFQGRLTWKRGNDFSIQAVILARSSNYYNSFGAGLDKLNQHFFFWLPKLVINSSAMSFGYEMYANSPESDELNPTVNANDPLSVYTGNPNLAPVKSHYTYYNFNRYYPSSESGFSVNMSGQYFSNAVTESRTYSDLGVQHTTPANVAGNYSADAEVSYNKRLNRNKQLRLNYNNEFSFNLNRDYFFVSDKKMARDLYSYSLSNSFLMNYKTFVSIIPEYSIDYNHSKSENSTQTFNSFIHKASSEFNIQFSKRLSTEATYLFRYNTVVADGARKSINLINASVAYQFAPKAGELKLTIFDLLNQNNSVSSYVQEARAIKKDYNILKQYFMLIYTYNFKRSAR